MISCVNFNDKMNFIYINFLINSEIVFFFGENSEIVRCVKIQCKKKVNKYCIDTLKKQIIWNFKNLQKVHL
jgi:hypothetical protein